MVFSVSVATLFISNTINDYYSYKVITQAKITQNDSIVMPQITVCQYANVSDAAYEIKYCWFEGLNCSSEYMFVELFLKNGEKRRCLRFNGGRNSSGTLEFYKKFRNLRGTNKDLINWKKLFKIVFVQRTLYKK